jgi:hypothetical protein
MLDTGCWILDAGWVLDAGYWMLDARYWMLVSGCRVLGKEWHKAQGTRLLMNARGLFHKA